MRTNADAPIQDLAHPTASARSTRRLSRPEANLTLPAPTPWQRLYAPLRRVVEIATTVLLLAASLPVLMLAALAVKLTSRGPAFYTQARVGQGGRIFTIFKLRTMIDNCESLTGPRWCMPDDPRITWFGWLLRRTHLDELPQLWNVLRGDMSLIGPRPERPEFVAELTEKIPGYALRLRIRPGITGLAQVHLPPDTDVDSVRRKLVYDLYYVRRFGPWLDVRLLACTALHALAIPFAIAGSVCFIPSKSHVEGVESIESHETRLRSTRAAA